MATVARLPHIETLDLEKTEKNLEFATNKVKAEDDSGVRIINFQEVSCHDQPYDCWVVIYDRVYDVTNFVGTHPGGEEILLEHAGRDASVAFRGTGHSAFAIKTLHQFLIGVLPLNERIFRKPDGFKISDLPE